MILVAGALDVDSGTHEAYLERCRGVVGQARATDGCLDVALSPDVVDARRINVYERWATRKALLLFPGSGASGEQHEALQVADVQKDRIDG